ncbi:unnamed protein product [Anisakis simplex]|uniref:Uncharacterized protein n=1 Tax=Anisakis simplex TaxID=6269 RepID=A0A3P6SBV5_ANISI|nr:unnamed protein product [Anisakis simplex]
MHHSVLRTHKQCEQIIYEVYEEDIYIEVTCYKCLNLSNCSRSSNVHTIESRPSLAHRHSAAVLGDNTRRIGSLRDLDNWLQNKMQISIASSDEKNIYY